MFQPISPIGGKFIIPENELTDVPLHDLGGHGILGAIVSVSQVLVGEGVVGVVGALVAVGALLRSEKTMSVKTISLMKRNS